MNVSQEIIEALKTHGIPEIEGGAAIVIGPIISKAIAAAVQAEREACADECEAMVMYPGGRQMAPKHNDVWAAAKAIRARGSDTK